MSKDDRLRLLIALEQMDRLLRALDDLKDSTLKQDPRLFATLAEGPLDHLSRLRVELDEFAETLQPSA